MTDVNALFIYLTGRCTLNCSYCYLRKRSARDLSWPKALRILNSLYPRLGSPRKVVFSGGEPFLCYPTLKKLALQVRRRFGWIPLSVQTNGLLLDKRKFSFLLAVRAGLEIGIDGKEETCVRHRRGLSGRGYARLLANIRAARMAGVPVNCTMTVHPDQVGCMEENFYFLKDLGLGSIDITPAAFMPWKGAPVQDFCRIYSRILCGAPGHRKVLVTEDCKLFNEPFLDLSIYPDGSVLCGDAFSCLSPGLKHAGSLVSPEGKVDGSRLRAFIRRYALLWKGGRACTYRDYVRRSFEIVDRMLEGALHAGELNAMMRFISGENLRSAVNGKTDPG